MSQEHPEQTPAEGRMSGSRVLTMGGEPGEGAWWAPLPM